MTTSHSYYVETANLFRIFSFLSDAYIENH